MCEAALIGQMATGLQIAGAVSGAYGSYQKSKSDEAAYDYQAQVARNNAQVQKNNAQIADMQAKSAIEQGQSEEANQRLKTAQTEGTQRARLAAMGVDLNEGSALNTLLDTDYMGNTDALTIRDNAAKEAWSLRAQAGNYQYGADNDLANAGLLQSRADSESPLGSAASSLLGGAGQVAASWYKRSTAGVPKK